MAKKPDMFIVVATLALFCVATTTTSAKETVYEVLPKYGLPSGLLPNTVTDYTLSEEDGRFVVHLDKPCYVQFDYLVYYEKTITGKLSYGSISGLKGIQVQSLFWFNVDEIRVDLPPSNNIYFQVGIINKKLNVDQFKTVHSCRNSLRSSPCHRKLPVPSSSSYLLPAPLEEIPMLLTE